MNEEGSPPAEPSTDGRRAASMDPTERPPDRPPLLWGDLVLALAVLAFGAWFLVGAFEIRLTGGYAQVGPRFFPFVTAGGLLLCGALLAVQAIRGQAAPLEGGEDVDVTAAADWRAVGILSAALIVDVLLIERLGFVLSSALLFWGVAFGFGSRHYLRDPLIGLVLATLVYLAFTRLLDLTLPAGVLPLAVLPLASSGPLLDAWPAALPAMLLTGG